MRRLLVPALIALAASAAADEGMWMPSQLPELGERLEAAGLELDPSALGDLTEYPLGAVVWLGGCTASFVSPQGLVATNHHCAYGSIQHNSTDENNILENGFLARSLEEELPAAPGSRVLVTIEVNDVTVEILGSVPEDATGKERYDAIEAAEKLLIARCEERAGVRCRVRSFYGGLQYKLFTQLEIRDVRLVYAPPRSVGKYGGDIDNWMWPRHTGDFSFLRAYVGPDGMPADPAPENVPFQPQHWLRVAPGGVGDGDFVMVAGYPGRTNRYRLADEVAFSVEWYYPTAADVYGKVLAFLEEALERYPDARLKYEPRLAGINNRTKNYRGMLAGFENTDVAAAKRELERDLEDWIAADPERAERYGSALEDLRRLVARRQERRQRDLYWGVVRYWSPLSTAMRLYRLAQERRKPDIERKPGYQERDVDRIRRRLERMERTYDARVDREVAMDRILLYAELPPAKRVEPFDRYFGIDPGGIDAGELQRTLETMYEETALGDLETRLDWLDAEVADFESSEDPFIRLAVALYPAELEMEEEDEALSGAFKEARPRFMEALIAYQENRGLSVYPDANSTLRVTFGHVAGYAPRDGVFYKPFTTLQGLLEKETGEMPFDSPESLLQAVRAGRHGPYEADELNSVPIDFLSTLDTTGGNSGSPSLNSRGELVGLLFDGAWESLLSDWYYEPELVRSIHTDVRYMLWVMDRVDGAHRLLEEMGVEPAFAGE
ncbi:MAG: S46 family peptidase [Candidatus Eisenbacteria bacterium]|nr:S46 family peptidase [Candidatus Eisenbacteria bacterium]